MRRLKAARTVLRAMALAVVVVLFFAATPRQADAAQLQTQTVAAFDRYVQISEKNMAPSATMGQP